jgi:hypothetical protein
MKLRWFDRHFAFDLPEALFPVVKDLLMDTGLGIRAYSVIEQGKIGMILSKQRAAAAQPVGAQQAAPLHRSAILLSSSFYQAVSFTPSTHSSRELRLAAMSS